MRILLTGGGTGGHILPNIALIAAFRDKYQKNGRLLYLGSRNSLEQELCLRARIPFQSIITGKLRRYFSLRNFVDLLLIPAGIIQALIRVWRFQPDVVWSKGGYVSLPVIIAAVILRKKIVIHESDSIAGLATKISAPFAKAICLGWPETLGLNRYHKKIQLTGIPLRENIYSGNKQLAQKHFGLDPKKPLLVVMGGSTGATSVNLLIEHSLTEITKQFQVIHICGKNKRRPITIPKNTYYRQFEYIEAELPDVYAAADIIISRGGANALAELITLKKKAIIIPLPKSASRGDQIRNAELAAKTCQFMQVLPQEQASPKSLMHAINILQKKHIHATDNNLHKSATKNILNLIEKIASKQT